MSSTFEEKIIEIKKSKDYPGYYPEYPPRNKFSLNTIDNIPITDNNFRKEIYIHIPFCNNKCHYCNLNSVTKKSLPLYNNYCKALLKEIELYSNHFDKTQFFNIDNLYFGGGTPSILGVEKITSIVNKIREIFNYQGSFSIETTPELIKYESLKSLKKLGLSRISIGIQSFNNDELTLMNRKPLNIRKFRDQLENIKELGINTNLDFIYGSPFQNKENLNYTLEQLRELSLDSVFFYPLRIKEHTVYSNKYKNHDNTILNDYEHIRENMIKLGYIQSSFLEYIKEDNGFSISDCYKYVIGFGALATSYYEDIHIMNTTGSLNLEFEIDNYIQSLFKNKIPPKTSIKLDRNARMRKFLILGLRNNFLAKNNFFKLFNDEINVIFNDEINQLKKYSFIIEENDYFKLTSLGMKKIENLTKLLFIGD